MVCFCQLGQVLRMVPMDETRSGNVSCRNFGYRRPRKYRNFQDAAELEMTNRLDAISPPRLRCLLALGLSTLFATDH
jgi:hypothetical protein